MLLPIVTTLFKLDYLLIGNYFFICNLQYLVLCSDQASSELNELLLKNDCVVSQALNPHILCCLLPRVTPKIITIAAYEVILIIGTCHNSYAHVCSAV